MAPPPSDGDGMAEAMAKKARRKKKRRGGARKKRLQNISISEYSLGVITKEHISSVSGK
jgi:hypothetical protein